MPACELIETEAGLLTELHEQPGGQRRHVQSCAVGDRLDVLTSRVTSCNERERPFEPGHGAGVGRHREELLRFATDVLCDGGDRVTQRQLGYEPGQHE